MHCICGHQGPFFASSRASEDRISMEDHISMAYRRIASASVPLHFQSSLFVACRVVRNGCLQCCESPLRIAWIGMTSLGSPDLCLDLRMYNYLSGSPDLAQQLWDRLQAKQQQQAYLLYFEEHVISHRIMICIVSHPACPWNLPSQKLSGCRRIS